MAWRDRLRPGSFRGVPFFIDVSSFTGGRRVQLHEFLQRDNSFAEDLGKVTPTFKVEGHILGDYWDQKNALLRAVEKQGPGELIHPYFGTVQVQLGAFSIEEDTKEGQIAKIQFQFYLAGENQYPNNVEDKPALLENQSEATLAIAKEDFDNGFNILGQPGFVVDRARAQVEEIATALESSTEGVSTTADNLADFAFSIRNLRAEVDDLIKTPALLSQRLLDSVALLEGAVDAPEGSFQAYSTLFTFVATPSTSPYNTPPRTQEAINTAALQNLTRRIGIINGSKQVADIEYETLDAALNTKNQLSGLIDEQISNTDNDDLFQSFKDLNARLVENLPNSETQLPSLETIELNSTISSLELAYDLYGSLEGEQDILNRNEIENPGFILGGTAIEVIGDV